MIKRGWVCKHCKFYNSIHETACAKCKESIQLEGNPDKVPAEIKKMIDYVTNPERWV